MLLGAQWQALRIEVFEWDKGEGPGETGFDGYSRFWCEYAVLGIYWIAEFSHTRLEIQLTPDIELVAFNCRFEFEPETILKRRLVENTDWLQCARRSIRADSRQELQPVEAAD